MENKRIDRQTQKTLMVALLAFLVLAAYFLIDGLGIIVSTTKMVSVNESLSNSSTDAAAILHNMLKQHISRILYLSVALYPIILCSIRFHMPFPKANGLDIKRLAPYLRLFLGAMVFYYTLTISTTFPHEVFTTYYSFGAWRHFFRIVGAVALFGLFVIDWSLFLKDLKAFPSSHPYLFKGLFVAFISTCSCMMVEYQIGSKMNMLSNMLIINILYWIILQTFIDLFTRNVKIGSFVSIVLSFIIGLVNDVVYQFRGNYIMYGDLTVVRTALEVAGNYTYKPGLWFWIAFVILLASSFVTVIIKFPKHQRTNVKEMVERIMLAGVMVLGVIITFNNGMLYDNVFGVGWNYNQNVAYTGYIPYFLSNMNSIASVTLDGYEVGLAEQAFDSVPVQDEDEHSYPNIIIIQNEAFSDLSILYDIETNRDYMPFIHSLTENTRKGYLNMSLTGGPTANTEFEVLMRSTLNYLPYGSVPYTQYIDDDLPSAVQVLRNQEVPYHTVAYHPYYSSGYSRTNVYNHFGFDEIVFENNFRDDFPASDLPRDYLSDSADYRRVEQMYEEFRCESDDPWFCFNVTIQNHGGYTQIYEPVEEDRIYVTNFDAPDSLNSYLSLIKTSDDAFRELIEYFSQCDEPTVIAMYGDHQPTLDNDALEALENYTGEQVYNYYVPYIIWANYDIEESDTLGDLEHEPVLNTLSTNYFASTVFEIAGVELSDYDRYLLDLHEQVPAVTAIGVWDSDGNYYSSVDSSPYSEDLTALQMVQYNLIFDDDNRLTDRFE